MLHQYLPWVKAEKVGVTENKDTNELPIKRNGYVIEVGVPGSTFLQVEVYHIYLQGRDTPRTPTIL